MNLVLAQVSPNTATFNVILEIQDFGNACNLGFADDGVHLTVAALDNNTSINGVTGGSASFNKASFNNMLVSMSNNTATLQFAGTSQFPIDCHGITLTISRGSGNCSASFTYTTFASPFQLKTGQSNTGTLTISNSAFV